MSQFNLALLVEGCAKLGQSIDPQQQQHLIHYLQIMLRWNQRLNLTAITDGDEMLVQHVLDAISALPFCRGERILDVGSGAGLPGMVFAIMRPTWQLVLLDSRGKRVSFLRHVVAELGLTNVQAVHDRVENWHCDEKFSSITARAFAPLPKILQNTGHLAAQGGRLVALKGKIATQEMAQLSAQQQQSTQCHDVQVPFMQAKRAIITYDY